MSDDGGMNLPVVDSDEEIARQKVDTSNRRSRRKSTKGVKYSLKQEGLSDSEDEGEIRPKYKIMPCMATSTRADPYELIADCFVGRRINEKTGEVEYRVKFEKRSHLHLAWMTFNEVAPILGGEHRDRMRVQAYERKLKREGYALMEDADDLPVSSITIDCILRSKQARLPTLEESLAPWKRKVAKPTYPTVTSVFLYEHQEELMTRLKFAVDRLITEPGSEPFRAPVDIDEIPDYLDHVATQMDLGTIAARLHRGEFYLGGSAHHMCYADVLLVFTNCMTYNQEGSEIYNVAKELKESFERQYNDWIISPSAWLPSLDGWKPWESGCSICNVVDDDVDSTEDMILCDRCDAEYHLHCLSPPLKKIPTGDWFCSYCDIRNDFDEMESNAKRMKALSATLICRGDHTLGVHEVDDSAYPRVLWEAPVGADKDKVTSTAGKGASNKGSAVGTGSTFETVYLAKWQGLSHRFCTWERTVDIPNKDMIESFKRFNTMPTEAEIRKTVCQLPCCSSQKSQSSYGTNSCQKDRFCTLGYFHSGDCSRELVHAESGSKEYARQRMVDQVRAQLYAYHRIMNNKKLDNNLLKQCGMYTAGYALRRVFFPKEEKAADEFDINEESGGGDDDSEDLSDSEEEEDAVFGGFYSNFRRTPKSAASKGIKRSEDDDDDEDDDEEEEGELEEEVCNIMSGMVEHVALAKELPSLVPEIVPAAERCEYEARVIKGPYGLGMRLGLTEEGLVKCVGFQKQPDGSTGPAESTGLINVGDFIIKVNRVSVVGLPFNQMVMHISQSLGSVLLTFRTERGSSNFPKHCNAVDVATDVISNSEYIIFPYPDTNDPMPCKIGSGVSSAVLQQLKNPNLVRQIQAMAPNGPIQHLFEAVCDNTVDLLEHFRIFLPMGVIEAMERAKRLKAEQRERLLAQGGENIANIDEFVPYEKSPTYKGSRALREYQVEGLNWIVSNWHSKRSCILADEMGLGKTVQVVSVLEHLRTEENIRGPYLVVVPLSTIQHWRREIEDWTDMNVCVYHDVGDSRTGTRAKDMRAFIRQTSWHFEQRRHGLLKFNILLTTYETLLADYEEFEPIHWRLMVVDEAHRLKSQNSKALKRMKALQIDRRLLLTGTPLQNNTQELWVLLNFLEPSQFDSFEDFNEEYGKLKSQEQVVSLQKQIAPYILRRVKEDVEKSIPPKEETVIEVELTTMQKRYYRAVYERNRSYLYVGVAGGVPSLINIQMQLRKCCNHPFLIQGIEDRELEEIDPEDEDAIMKHTIEASGKFVLVSKLLPKLKREGHKVLIFSQFLKQLDLLEQYCRHNGFGVERLDGSIQGHERQSSIDRFSRKNSKSFVFLLSTRAGGVGINLIAADTVIIFDSDWNPQNDLQAQARCHRIGQEKAVKIYRLITRNTFESQMFTRASQKLGLEHAILGTASFNETSILDDQPSAEELEELLKRGAYGLADDDDSAFRSFAERDIEDILKSNSHVMCMDAKKSRNIDRSSFNAEKGGKDLSVDDPNFWEKVLPGDMTVEMLKLKLQDRTALESRASTNKFLRNLQAATDTIMESLAGGMTKDGPVSDYDMAVHLWQKVVVMKKDFNESQRRNADEVLDVLHRSRVRSCRLEKPANNTAYTSQESFSRAGTKRKTKRKTVRTKKVLEAAAAADPATENSDAFLEDLDLCALCGDGGLILFCDGPCHRSFHLECLGIDEEPDVEEWICPDCEAGKHMCLECGKIGDVGKEGGVLQCSQGGCGRFYHIQCLQKNPKTVWVGRSRFKCPQHFCLFCDESDAHPKKVEKDAKKKRGRKPKVVEGKVLVKCIHCPKAIHMECHSKLKGNDPAKFDVLRLSKHLLICREHLNTVEATKKPRLKLTREVASSKKSKNAAAAVVDDQDYVDEDFEEEEKTCVLCIGVDKAKYSVDEDNDGVEGPFLDEVIKMNGKLVYVHANCALRSPEVYMDAASQLCNLQRAIKRGKLLSCTACRTRGATIGCSVPTCKKNYHLRCGLSLGGSFKEGGHNFYCKTHSTDGENTDENTETSRKRKVAYYMESDEEEEDDDYENDKPSKRVKVSVKMAKSSKSSRRRSSTSTRS